MVVMQFGLHFTSGIVYSIENSLKYEIIYICLALVIAVIISFSEQLIRKYVEISFSFKEMKDETNE